MVTVAAAECNLGHSKVRKTATYNSFGKSAAGLKLLTAIPQHSKGITLTLCFQVVGYQSKSATSRLQVDIPSTCWLADSITEEEPVSIVATVDEYSIVEFIFEIGTCVQRCAYEDSLMLYFSDLSYDLVVQENQHASVNITTQTAKKCMPSSAISKVYQIINAEDINHAVVASKLLPPTTSPAAAAADTIQSPVLYFVGLSLLIINVALLIFCVSLNCYYRHASPSFTHNFNIISRHSEEDRFPLYEM